MRRLLKNPFTLIFIAVLPVLALAIAHWYQAPYSLLSYISLGACGLTAIYWFGFLYLLFRNRAEIANSAGNWISVPTVFTIGTFIVVLYLIHLSQIFAAVFFFVSLIAFLILYGFWRLIKL